MGTLKVGTLNRSRAVRILLVDDSVADAKQFRLAVEDSGRPTVVQHVEDGAEALELLADVAGGRAPRPDLVVTALDMPRASGIDVVRHVRTDPALRTLPVVVFAGSRAAIDVATAYDCGATSYVVKPTEAAEFGAVVRAIDDYWAGTVRLP